MFLHERVRGFGVTEQLTWVWKELVSYISGNINIERLYSRICDASTAKSICVNRCKPNISCC